MNVADAPFAHGGFPTPSGKCEFYSSRMQAAKARVSDRARLGVVVGLSIWWKKFAEDGKNANEVTSQRVTDMGNGATFYDVLVQVEKCEF